MLCERTGWTLEDMSRSHLRGVIVTLDNVEVKLRANFKVACIGVGGQGGSNLRNILKAGASVVDVRADLVAPDLRVVGRRVELAAP